MYYHRWATCFGPLMKCRNKTASCNDETCPFDEIPLYLKTLLPKSSTPTPSYNLRISKSFTSPSPRTDRFKASFFPFCAISWDQIDPNIQNSLSLMSFKHSLLQFIRLTALPVYRVHHPRGLKLLTRLRLGFSHLREHKFRHNFQDTINPFCQCKTNDIETNEHFLLHCPNILHSVLYSLITFVRMISLFYHTIAPRSFNSSSMVVIKPSLLKDRTNQNKPNNPEQPKNNPEQARKSQNNPRTTQNKLEQPIRASQ